MILTEISISQREAQVLQLIAFEYTSKEIASKLCISRHTVESHRKNLLAKFNVRNSAGLIRLGFTSGILSSYQCLEESLINV